MKNEEDADPLLGRIIGMFLNKSKQMTVKLHWFYCIHDLEKTFELNKAQIIKKFANAAEENKLTAVNRAKNLNLKELILCDEIPNDNPISVIIGRLEVCVYVCFVFFTIHTHTHNTHTHTHTHTRTHTCICNSHQ